MILRAIFGYMTVLTWDNVGQIVGPQGATGASVDCRVQQDHKVHKEKLAPLVQVDLQVPLVHKAHRDHKDHKEKLAQLVQVV
jgi:hypothetical protein